MASGEGGTGGEDNCGFPIDLFLQAPDDILLCPICDRVVEVATECPCGHLFCGPHIRRWLLTGSQSCPTCRQSVSIDQLKDGPGLHLAYRRQLGDLKLQCANRPRGCTQTMTLDVYREHINTCDFSAVFCKWKGCPLSKGQARMQGKELIRKELSGHERDCAFRQVSCTLQGCGAVMAHKDLGEHRKSCATVSVACPVKGCGVTVTRGNLDHHLEDPGGLTQHVRLLINHVAELERPELVDKELVLRINDMEEKLEAQEFSFWSATHTLRVSGLGLAGYNFQLAVALKPAVEGRGPVLAMFLHIKPSEVDELLEWPFPIPYTLAVLDQNRPYPQHISRKIEDPVGQVEGTSYLRPGGGGWGYPQITVLDKLKTRGYTKNGVMFVRVSFHTAEHLF